MTWKNILKAQLAILDRNDVRSLMRQYRGEQAQKIGKNIALIQQNMDKLDVVKEFKIMMDNPVRGYDGIPAYNTVNATANVILVIDYKQLNRQAARRFYSGRNPEDSLDSDLSSLFDMQTVDVLTSGKFEQLGGNPFGSVRGRTMTEKTPDKMKTRAYQITFPFKVKFDAQDPLLFGAEDFIQFLEELEETIDTDMSRFGNYRD